MTRQIQIGTGILLTLWAAPLAAQAAAPAEADAPRQRQSWTADRREFSVGDVITVMVDEFTMASADMNDFASDRRRRDMVLAAGATGGPLTGSGAQADILTANDAESRKSGQSSRQNRFRGEITTRVVGIENGMLRIEGSKMIAVDKNQEELLLTGWVRPQDVAANNLVDSWRIGDAEIVYSSNNSLGKPKGGIISRLLGWLWP